MRRQRATSCELYLRKFTLSQAGAGDRGIGKTVGSDSEQCDPAALQECLKFRRCQPEQALRIRCVSEQLTDDPQIARRKAFASGLPPKRFAVNTVANRTSALSVLDQADQLEPCDRGVGPAERQRASVEERIDHVAEGPLFLQ